jgi:hypothetical protein
MQGYEAHVNKTSAFERILIAAGVLAVVALAATPVQAQKPVAAAPAPGAWTGTGFITADAGAQLTKSSYTSSVSFPLNGETATMTTSSSPKTAPAILVRAGVRVWKNLALGVGVTAVSSTPALDVTATLPHPFFFNTQRTVAGRVTGLERREVMAALELSWMVPISRRLDMSLFGGPAFFNVRQEMAAKVKYTESYPYDTATFSGVDSVQVSKSRVGFTAGVDVAYCFTKSVGIGGQLRFSKATATLSPVAGSSSSVDLGGAQVGGGLRIRF